MLTARNFIASWEQEDFGSLAPNLKEEPERLTREFFAILTDRRRSYTVRSLALKVLYLARRMLKVDHCPEIAGQLIRLFDDEFPPEELRAIGELGRAGGLDARYLFVLNIAWYFPILAPDGGIEITRKVREAFRDTLLEESVTECLRRFERESGAGNEFP